MDLAVILTSDSGKIGLALLVYGVWQTAAIYWGQRHQRQLFDRHEEEDARRHEETASRLDRLETRVEHALENFWSGRRRQG